MGGLGAVRINTRPLGEAPEWVRDCWIDLELPLAGKPKKYFGFGVLSGPDTFWRGLAAILRGHTIVVDGFPVDAERAVAILAVHSPDAANWWRRNCPHLVQQGQRFVFDKACGELVTS